MTWQEFGKRHAERYAKLIRREVTFEQMVAENDADWRAWIAAGMRDR